jgi:hypothetical protein
MFKSTGLHSILFLGALFGLLVFSLAQYVKNRRWEAKEMACRGRLSQIALALRNYRADYGVFPPTSITDENGQPNHSWRVLILPYVEQRELYAGYDLNEPWNSRKNIALLRSAPPFVNELFRCPNDSESPHAWTSFLAIDRCNGSDSCDRSIIPSGALDQSNRIALMDVHHSGINWTEPKDVPTQQAVNGVLRLSHNAKCSNFLTYELQIGTLSNNTVVFRGSEVELLKAWLPPIESTETAN